MWPWSPDERERTENPKGNEEAVAFSDLNSFFLVYCFIHVVISKIKKKKKKKKHRDCLIGFEDISLGSCY